jgi:hypothetical protein
MKRSKNRDASAAPEVNPATRQESAGVALFLALRGMGADVYAAEGGGEAWLARERAHFYSPSKKALAFNLPNNK